MNPLPHHLLHPQRRLREPKLAPISDCSLPNCHTAQAQPTFLTRVALVSVREETSERDQLSTPVRHSPDASPHAASPSFPPRPVPWAWDPPCFRPSSPSPLTPPLLASTETRCDAWNWPSSRPFAGLVCYETSAVVILITPPNLSRCRPCHIASLSPGRRSPTRTCTVALRPLPGQSSSASRLPGCHRCHLLIRWARRLRVQPTPCREYQASPPVCLSTPARFYLLISSAAQ